MKKRKIQKKSLFFSSYCFVSHECLNIQLYFQNTRKMKSSHSLYSSDFRKFFYVTYSPQGLYALCVVYFGYIKSVYLFKFQEKYYIILRFFCVFLNKYDIILDINVVVALHLVNLNMFEIHSVTIQCF